MRPGTTITRGKQPAESASESPVAALPLTLRLFGSFEWEQGGLPLPRTRTVKEKWLLALLVLRHRDSVERSWLAGTLWPDSTETQAGGNLRRSLNNLRAALGEHAYRLFSPTPRTLSFDLSGVSCDVFEFDSAIRRGDSAARERAAALYRGPFLAECGEAWAEPERNRREQEYLTLLESLAAHYAEAGDLRKSAEFLKRVVALDGFRESAQQSLMRTLAADGDIPGALLAYREFRLKLHDTLQTGPAPETVALYQEIRRGGNRVSVRSAPVSETVVSPLPRLLSRLIGREEEIEAVASLLEQSRLVTLSGSGGVGKTRLSLSVGERRMADFPGGIRFVELAAIRDPVLAAQAAADALGIRVPSGRSATEAVADFLGAKRALLILDNCEHLVDACAAFVKTLSDACPNLRFLATSRQPLGLRGERTWRVPSLSVPEPSATGDAILACDAVRLFLDRAVEASPQFALAPDRLPVVAEICRQLDGIPLAIELAAARVKALSVEEVRQRLSGRFRLLTTGDRSVLPRHQTLRALIDWSYDLLSASERILLYRLSVFVGGWTLAAAERVCGAAPLEEDAILDLLTSLVDKSLVTAAEQNGVMRFSLLETVREYAGEKRRESGEEETLRDRHRDWFLALAEEARPHFGEPDQGIWLERIRLENDNLRAALSRCAEQPTGAEPGLRIATSLYRFWGIRGNFREGIEQLSRAQTHPGASEFPLLRGRALYFIGLWEHRLGDSPLGIRHLEESLEILRQTGDRVEAAQAAGNLGLIAMELSDFDRAQPLLEGLLAVQRERGDRQQVAICLNNLGALAVAMGDFPKGRALYEECLSLRRELGNWNGVAMALANLGLLAFQEGDGERAVPSLREALSLWFEQESLMGINFCLRHLAHIHSERHPLLAARLWGAAETVREKTGEPVSALDRETYEAAVAAARSRVRAASFADAWAEGRGLSLEGAVNLALGDG